MEMLKVTVNYFVNPLFQKDLNADAPKLQLQVRQPKLASISNIPMPERCRRASSQCQRRSHHCLVVNKAAADSAPFFGVGGLLQRNLAYEDVASCRNAVQEFGLLARLCAQHSASRVCTQLGFQWCGFGLLISYYLGLGKP